MTRNYNRTNFYLFFQLSETQQAEVLNIFSPDDAENTLYAIDEENDKAIPLSAFIRTDGNFTHGIFLDSYFSGYFLTFSKCGMNGVLAYKYF
jgi:hypothetical protein